MVRADITATVRALDGIAAGLSDRAGFLGAVANRVRNDTLLNFRRGGVFPSAWKVSGASVARGGRTLVALATLRNSIHARVTGDRATVGTDVLYAAVHQFGAVIRPVRARKLKFRVPGGGWVSVDQVRIPARPFLPVDAAGRLRPETERWLEAEAARRFGLSRQGGQTA